MSNIILDTNVISLLAEKKTGGQLREQKDFYSNKARGHVWHVTREIMKELQDMLSREGKRELYGDCMKLLERKNAVQLPSVDLEPVLLRKEFSHALKAHSRTRSDRRDKSNIARAVLEGFPFFCHDSLLCRRAKDIPGLELVSWHLQPQSGQRTVKRGRGGNRIS